MRNLLRLTTVLAMLVGIGLLGCQEQPKAGEGEIGTTAPVNNNAPEAKNAPAAPSDPSISYPGGGKKGGGAPPR